MGSPDDPHPGPSAVLHTHADAYGNSSNDPHDKYDSEHDAGNGCAPKKEKEKVHLLKSLIRILQLFKYSSMTM